MRVEPFNKYVLVEPIVEKVEEEKKELRILLPDDFVDKKNDDFYGFFKVILPSFECKLSLANVGDTILVESQMVKEIMIKDTKYYFVNENYIVCVIDQPDDE